MTKAATHKIKGFTLLELMLVMLIAGVLFASGMMILRFTHQQRWILESTFEESATLNRASTQIMVDAQRAIEWSWNGFGSLQFIGDSLLVEYDFEKEVIQRKVKSTEGNEPYSISSFAIGVRRLNTYWRSQNVKKKGFPVDYFEIDFGGVNQGFQFSQFKNYGTANHQNVR